MERLHTPDARPFITSEISVQNILAEWIELGVHENIKKHSDLESVMNIPTAIFKEIESICNIDNLRCENEPVTFLPSFIRKQNNQPVHYVAPIDHNLQCLKIKETFNASRADRSCRRVVNPCTTCRFINPNSVAPNNNEIVPITQPELLLTVTLYRPYEKKTCSKFMKPLQVEQQMMVLGSQKLTDLRDRFACLADVTVLDNFSTTCYSDIPELANLPMAKDIFPSGFFYINGTFYNDMRKCDARDNSKVIIDWAKQYPDMDIGPFECKLMEETRFLDLKLRLGYPYLYQHQGNCEHLLIVQDIRLMNKEDNQDLRKYPIITSVTSRRRVVCTACHVLTAKWITTSNRRVHTDPFFFCESCFKEFNYDRNGQKVGQFIAQPFVDRSAVF